jgi:hypothetical protein
MLRKNSGAEVASEFTWRKKWDKVLEWNFTEPNVKWFIGGKLNITENCLDRHLAERGNQTAIIWEPNNPEEKFRTLTYKELHEEVCRFANVLKNNGAKKRRPYLHLHAHGAGTRYCGACLRAHRSHSFGGLWRIFLPLAGRAD